VQHRKGRHCREAAPPRQPNRDTRGENSACRKRQDTRRAKFIPSDRGSSRRGGFPVLNACFITVGKHRKSLTSKKQYPPLVAAIQRHESKKGAGVKTL